MQTVHFFYNYPLSLRNRNNLKTFIAKIFKNEKKEVTRLNVIFCDDKFLIKLNRDFLHHNYLTDILTFSLSQQNEPINAEIYISVPRVKENSHSFHQKFSQELLRVVFHGVLHLCGYKDETKAEKQVMTSKEDTYLQKYIS